ncbi:MAG: sugar phosphate nucleotidyltransferase [Kiritimatiellae bacterium]|nr:sugar phosphate nucleotidyltransferase [Kiritimatiellia bacterium]MDW8457771.1 sugar phosphate nucleotidyltransferase [Verrucomicrobiota bacterium]
MSICPSGFPSKAFILAAGFGTRLLPLTRTLPKPLIPVLQTPNLERLLAMLRRWGVRDVLINLHHRADRLFEHVRARKPDGLRIALSFEPVILGTGGALRRAEWWFAGNEPVWVLNGDVVMELDPAPLCAAYDPARTIAVAWVHGALGPRTVEVREGRIVNFASTAPGSPGTFTFCGVQLVNPRLLDRAKGYLAADERFESIISAYQRAQADGWTVAAVESPGSFWADIGTPQQWIACTRALHGDSDFVDAHPTARIHPRAIVRNAIIGPDAILGPSARVEGAIVAARARVDVAVPRMALPAADAFDPPALHAIQSLGWDPSTVTALPLSPRGSARSFTRLARGRETAILVQYDPARIENTYHARHTRFLRALRIPVPRVLVDRPADCIAVFEDLGDCSLLDWQRGRPPSEVAGMYQRILRIAERFHRRGAAAARERGIPLMPAFRPRLYRWEREYFAEEMLRKRERLPPERIAEILRELAGIARRLQRASSVLVHRDLQSSNILIRDGAPWLIDYQGMRFGPAAYDVASLLCDPYVELPEALIGELLEDYARRSQEPEQVRELFWHAAIQRLAQALGAFAKLGSQPDTREFAAHIPAAKRMMLRAIRHAGGFPALRAWCET